MKKRIGFGPFALVFESELTIKDFQKKIMKPLQNKATKKHAQPATAFDALRQLNR